MRISLIPSLDRVVKPSPRREWSLSETKISRFVQGRFEVRVPLKTVSVSRKGGMPIGLKKNKTYVWLNAWIQFLIHLPYFSELISFTSKSCGAYREFFDQYVEDQKRGNVVCCIDTYPLIRPIFSVVQLSPSGMGLYEMMHVLFRFMFPLGSLKISSIIFHPEWVILWEGEEVIELVEEEPLEIIIAVEKGRRFPLKRQIFPKKGRFLYDLDSFIEERSDGFVSYIQVDGIWYQCEDESVRVVSSRMLQIPLCRGVLFHYKKKNW